MVCGVQPSESAACLYQAVWSAVGGDENADHTWEQSMWMSWGLFFDPGTQTGALLEELRHEILLEDVQTFMWSRRGSECRDQSEAGRIDFLRPWLSLQLDSRQQIDRSHAGACLCQ